jgi:hypothetical protein
MARFARVTFPRDPADYFRLLTPSVAECFDDPPLSSPAKSHTSVNVDVELLAGESLPASASDAATRALTKVKDLLPHFLLPIDGA